MRTLPLSALLPAQAILDSLNYKIAVRAAFQNIGRFTQGNTIETGQFLRFMVGVGDRFLAGVL